MYFHDNMLSRMHVMIICVLFSPLTDKENTNHANCTDGELRLVGGVNATLGVVQVCMNNAWGSVCNNRFGTNDAVVVCRQLGFPTTGAVAFRDTSPFEIPPGPVFLDQLHCRGTETNVMECSQNVHGLSECDSSEIAGVQCIGECIS